MYSAKFCPSLFIVLLACLGGCGQLDRTLTERPSIVALARSEGAAQLVRNGHPFFIKGAGGDGSLKLLKECGGNSIRTWHSDNLESRLAEAQALGLTVTVGIWLGHKEHGFDYNDATAVAGQLEMARQAVLRYRNHPALLMWGVGNEMEGFELGDDPKVWRAVEDVAKMIKALDPNHPTMTAVAEIGGDRVKAIHALCPSIDLVGINSYGGAPSLPQRYVGAGGTKPYLLTEYGPPGSWELNKNSWGACVELSSTEKDAYYRRTYQRAIVSQPLCVGSYAFIWGSKQEATATWFGLMLPDGSKLESVDTLTELWGGRNPAGSCPKIINLSIDGPPKVKSGESVSAHLRMSEWHGEPLKVSWVLSYDPAVYPLGGSTEPVPAQFANAVVRGDANGATLKMPSVRGGYRLFVYVRTTRGAAATANIPLFVTDGETPPP